MRSLSHTKKLSSQSSVMASGKLKDEKARGQRSLWELLCTWVAGVPTNTNMHHAWFLCNSQFLSSSISSNMNWRKIRIKKWKTQGAPIRKVSQLSTNMLHACLIRPNQKLNWEYIVWSTHGLDLEECVNASSWHWP